MTTEERIQNPAWYPSLSANTVSTFGDSLTYEPVSGQ